MRDARNNCARRPERKKLPLLEVCGFENPTTISFPVHIWPVGWFVHRIQNQNLHCGRLGFLIRFYPVQSSHNFIFHFSKRLRSIFHNISTLKKIEIETISLFHGLFKISTLNNTLLSHFTL